jgi:hypothetical protein
MNRSCDLARGSQKWATDLADTTDLHGLLTESIRANPSNPFDPWSIPQWVLENALVAERSRYLIVNRPCLGDGGGVSISARALPKYAEARRI